MKGLLADLARHRRRSRARTTQMIMDLVMLAPEIQEDLLFGQVDVPLKS
jgi:hypothetical protein